MELVYKAPGSTLKATDIGVNFDGAILYNGSIEYEKNGQTWHQSRGLCFDIRIKP